MPADKDTLAKTLSDSEDKVQTLFDEIANGPGADHRWAAIANTHLQQAYMAMKRSMYEGKRATDEV